MDKAQEALKHYERNEMEEALDGFQLALLILEVSDDDDNDNDKEDQDDDESELPQDEQIDDDEEASRSSSMKREDKENMICMCLRYTAKLWMDVEHDFTESLSCLERAVEILSRQRKKDHHLIWLADCWQRKGQIYAELKRLDESLECFQEAVQCLQDAYQDKTTAFLSMALAESYNNIGSLYQSEGCSSLALAHLEKSLQILLHPPSFLDDDEDEPMTFSWMHIQPSRMSVAIMIASTCNNVGWVLQQQQQNQGDLERALGYYQSALSIYQDQYQKVSSDEVSTELATTHRHVGMVLKKQGRLREALSHYQKALLVEEELQQDCLRCPLSLAACFHMIGVLWEELGSTENAVSYYKRAVQVQERVTPVNANVLAKSYHKLGTLLCEHMEDFEQGEEALSCFVKCRAVLMKHNAENHDLFLDATLHVAQLAVRNGHLDLALKTALVILKGFPNHAQALAVQRAAQERLLHQSLHSSGKLDLEDDVTTEDEPVQGFLPYQFLTNAVDDLTFITEEGTIFSKDDEYTTDDKNVCRTNPSTPPRRQ